MYCHRIHKLCFVGWKWYWAQWLTISKPFAHARYVSFLVLHPECLAVRDR